MAATFVQANAGTGVASGKVATAQYGVNVTAGNLLVACVARRAPTGSVAVVSVNDDVGNRWKQAAEGCTIGALFSDAHQRGVDVWYCDQATGANRPVVTATWQGFPDSGVNNGMRVLVLEYGGGAGGYECVETIGVGEVDGTTGTVTTIDNCSANDLLVSIVGNNASANTVPAGWNSRVNDTTYGMAVADLLDSGAGGATKSAAWTGMTSNTKGYGLVVAFKLGGTRAANAIRCVRTQWRIEELFSTNPGLLNAVSPDFWAPTAGNTLFAYLSPYGGGGVVSVTDDHDNTWELVFDGGYDPTGNGHNSLWMARNCKAGAATMQLQATLSEAPDHSVWNETFWLLMEYVNLPTDAIAVNGENVLSFATTAHPTATVYVTPSTPTLVLGCLGGAIDNFAGLKPDAGWHGVFSDSGAEVGVIEKVTSSPAQQTAGWTYNTAQPGSVFVVALASPTSSSAVSERRAAFTAPELPQSIGQRAESVEWEVLDATHSVMGTVAPQAAGASTRHNVGSDIIRTVERLILSKDDCAGLDVLTTRIRPVWVMDDLSRWPLGVFLFSAADRQPRSWPVVSYRSMSMYDQNALLLDKCREPFGMPRSASIRNAIIQLLEEVHQ